MSIKGKKVVCFGEVLWDNLPTGPVPGGAPMNVAYHLSKLGLGSTMISAVGNDPSGKELTKVLNAMQLDTTYCYTVEDFNTSEVKVLFTEDNEVRYDIIHPVAWDHIEHRPELDGLVKESDCLVYGSLSGRSEVTRTTLTRLLSQSRYNVLDINLRPPYFEKAYLEELLSKTHLLKLNLNELETVSGWFGTERQSTDLRVKELSKIFTIPEIILTLGKIGAIYYSGNIRYHAPANEVTVEDTVGSGDSFLAAFLSRRLTGSSIEDSMDWGSVYSSFITSKTGSCPAYSAEDLDVFAAGARWS